MPLKVNPNRKQRGQRPQSDSTSLRMRTRVEQDIHSSPRGSFSDSRAGAAPIPILTSTPSKKLGRDVLIRPKTVTPLNFDANNSPPSWEDYDEGVYGAVNKIRRSKDYNVTSHMDASHNFSVNSSYDEEEEMPMDEQKHSSMKTSTPTPTPPRAFAPDNSGLIVSNTPARTNVSKITVALEANSSERPDGLTLEERMLWDAIQCTIVNASKRPRVDAATSELHARLSDSEAIVEKLKQELLLYNNKNKSTTTPPTSHQGSAVTRINQLEEQLRESQALLKLRESEHDAEVRAIQRVLAEMSSEREEETKVLNDTIATLSERVNQLENEKRKWHGKSELPLPPSIGPLSSDSVATSEEPKDATSKKYVEEIQKLKTIIVDLESEKLASQKDLERKTRHSMVLERELKVLKAQLMEGDGAKGHPENDHPSSNVDALKAELEQVKERNLKLKVELDTANKERKARRKTVGSTTPPRPDITSHADIDSVVSEMSAEDVESLQKTLSETTSSLENAKKIIASLENANGSMAMDLRSKLKVKEEELAAVQKEAAERKRRLDSLATELRDLQKKQDDVDKLATQSRTQIVRHKALMGLLEKSVSGLQAASAVHEVTTASGQPDLANVEQISDILNDAMVAIRTSLEYSEQYIDEFDDDSTAFTDGGEVSSDIGRQIDSIIKNDREALAMTLQNELEQKKIAVRRLEEALKKQNEEIRRLRHEQKSTGDSQQLLAEIKSLREQCSNNVELLAKKERELSVLRSSLKVDDNETGYISDDASDGEDENGTTMSSASARTNGYGTDENDALATILAAGSNLSDQPESKNELLKAIREKERATKELKAERESLANAKLIISSLEKANKSMMEDLRSRLQESNSAISSLLDKSVESEKNSDTLRKEVDKLRKEKENLESQLQKYAPDLPDVDKSRDDNSVALAEEKKDSL